MRDPTTRRGPSPNRDPRSRTDSEGQRRPGRSQGASADQLLEIAGALEEQARALMNQARHLQRLAATQDRAETERASSPRGRPGGFGGGGPRRESPGRSSAGRGTSSRGTSGPGASARDTSGRDESRDRRPTRQDGEQRPRKSSSKAPSWAPGGKKRKP